MPLFTVNLQIMIAWLITQTKKGCFKQYETTLAN